MGIREIAEQFRRRSISPVELTTDCLARIEKLNPKLNAFITVTAESALARQRQGRLCGNGYERIQLRIQLLDARQAVCGQLDGGNRTSTKLFGNFTNPHDSIVLREYIVESISQVVRRSAVVLSGGT